MKSPTDHKTVGGTMSDTAAGKSEPLPDILRRCPFIRKEPAERPLNQPDDLLDTLLDGQDVMLKLHISQRTLQTLRSNGTLPFTRIGRKIYYFRRDIERLLKDNYVMYHLHEHYGKDSK